jgi:hypothetical protein
VSCCLLRWTNVQRKEADETIFVCSDTFNYTPVTAGGVILIALILWFVSARKYYKGPVRTITTDESYAGGEYYRDEYTVHGENRLKPPEIQPTRLS